MLEPSSIVCALGPTNTGKTHRAVERMLEHASGMLGFPLRLLAREIYDRLTARLGEARVALVTGEEKRVPRRPDYWVCTVEAMPLEREVDFLAVDEIQLAAHRQRGHAFTDRLLRARGRRETWFLGSDTMAPLARELLPTARLETYPRLSQLRWAGACKLAQLPPRSAVVAFSAEEVYTYAERLRAVRGGAAVVLGALSPRTRNAQVAMFQAGEVDYLVATDAIGMGLNLAVEHVAFGALHKFDGRDVRALEPAELGQIAGRAGRHLQDGTFGSLLPLTLEPELALAVETHRFMPVRRLYYRNAELDFSSLEALRSSLRLRPRPSFLIPVEKAEDLELLERLSQDELVRVRCRDAGALRLLWELCQIPDYRKLLLDVHLALVRQLFLQLTGPRGRIEPDFLEQQVGALEDVAGDVEALLARIAAVRTFTYVSQHTRWLEQAEAWQERTRALEDRLSDALHERLVQRFVEKGTGRRGRTSASSAAAGPRERSRRSGREGGEPPFAPQPHHPFAQLASLRLGGSGPAPKGCELAKDWAEGAIEAEHASFRVDELGQVSWQGRLLGRLSMGPSLTQPMLVLGDVGPLPPGTRPRLQRRLAAFAKDHVRALFEPLHRTEARDGTDGSSLELPPALRGLLHQVEQGLGCAVVEEALPQLRELGVDASARLGRVGLLLGRRYLYAPSLLSQPSLASRQLLLRIYRPELQLELPRLRPGQAAWKLGPRAKLTPEQGLALGYALLGGWAIRVDLFERGLCTLEGPDSLAQVRVEQVARWWGVPRREMPSLLRGLDPAHALGEVSGPKGQGE